MFVVQHEVETNLLFIVTVGPVILKSSASIGLVIERTQVTPLLTAIHVPQRWLYGVLIAARMSNVRAGYAHSVCQQQLRVASIVGKL